MGLLNRLLKPSGIQSGGIIKAEHISQIWDAITGENLVHSLNFPYINIQNLEIRAFAFDITYTPLQPDPNLTGNGASNIKYINLPEPVKFGILTFYRNTTFGSYYPDVPLVFTPFGNFSTMITDFYPFVVVTEDVNKSYRLGGPISNVSDYGLSNLPSWPHYLATVSYSRNNGLIGIYPMTKRSNIHLNSYLSSVTVGDIVLRNAWLDSSQGRLYFDFVLLENTTSFITRFKGTLIYARTIP